MISSPTSQFVIACVGVMSPIKKSLKKKIFSHYFDLKYPGSFQSVQKFKDALQRESNITISEKALRKLLKDNAWYQSNVARPKKFLTRKFSGTGVGLLCMADQAFLQLPNKQMFVFLVLADSVSKYVYARPLAKNNPQNLKKAFKSMFKTQNCPYFPLVKVDKDKNMVALRTFFAERKMLLKQKRGISHLHLLEPLIRVLKKKMIQSFRRQRQRKVYSDQFLANQLREAVSSFNTTINNSHKMTPQQANDPRLDPLLRKRQFPAEPLVPFDKWYTAELRRQKKANTPDVKARNNMDERPDNYRLNDEVWIDYDTQAVGRSYHQKAGRVYYISKIDTREVRGVPWGFFVPKPNGVAFSFFISASLHLPGERCQRSACRWLFLWPGAPSRPEDDCTTRLSKEAQSGRKGVGVCQIQRL